MWNVERPILTNVVYCDHRSQKIKEITEIRKYANKGLMKIQSTDQKLYLK